MKSLLSLLLLCTFISLSCAKSATPKTITGSDKELVDVSEVINSQKSARDIKFDSDPTFSSASTNLIISAHSLRKALLMYNQSEGGFPVSTEQLVEAHYLLLWPRDEIAEKPIHFVENLTNPDEENFTDFTFTKLNNSQCEFKYVTYDQKTSKETGRDEWKLADLSIPNINLPLEHDELKVISIICGKKEISKITNSDVRKAYILYGQLANYLTAKSGHYFSQNNMLPGDYSELFDGSCYVISENLAKLSDLANVLNADFRWGFDYDKSTEYCYLKIGSEKFIEFCVVHGAGRKDLISRYDCDLSKLDMSEPLISSANISSISNSEDLMISANSLFHE